MRVGRRTLSRLWALNMLLLSLAVIVAVLMP